jgi:hypothetical protein
MNTEYRTDRPLRAFEFDERSPITTSHDEASDKYKPIIICGLRMVPGGELEPPTLAGRAFSVLFNGTMHSLALRCTAANNNSTMNNLDSISTLHKDRTRRNQETVQSGTKSGTRF